MIARLLPLAALILVGSILLGIFWRSSRARSVPSAQTFVPGEPATGMPAPDELNKTDEGYTAREAAATKRGAHELAPGLPLMVTTRKGLFSDAATVPSISVEIGVGSLKAPDSPVLARATTDENGRAEISIPWCTVEAARGDPSSRIWVRVVAPGFQQRTQHALLPATLAPTAVSAIAIPGGALRGRLLDADGRPVAGRVSAKRPLPDGCLSGAWGQETTADGGFELLLSEEGSWDIVGEAGPAGTGVLRDHPIRFTTPPEFLELSLSGPGIVRGRVHDAAGHPAAALDLCILASRADDAVGSFVVPDSVATALELEGRGRYWATTTTDAEGAFDVRGLRADRFVVRAQTNLDEGYPRLLTPSPVQSDGAALELVLDRPHIAVRVVDEKGNLLTAEIVTDPRHWPGPAEDWPETPRVVVAPLLAEAHLGDPKIAFVPGKRASDSELVFEVPESRTFLVGLLGGSARWRPRVVEVLQGASRVEVTLVAPAQVETGEIVVSANGPDGEALVWKVAIRIEDPDSGLPLVYRGPFFQYSWPQRFRLPEGEYRVIVEGAPVTDFHHGTLDSPRTCGRYVTTVRVEPGRGAQVIAEIPAGAKLHLVLRGETRAEDRRAIQERYPSLEASSIESSAEKASLLLASDDGWPVPVEFTYHLGATSAAGTHLTSQIALGSDETSQVLPAGRFRLEARMPGGRVATQEIVLVDGRTTDVSLEIPP